MIHANLELFFVVVYISVDRDGREEYLGKVRFPISVIIIIIIYFLLWILIEIINEISDFTKIITISLYEIVYIYKWNFKCEKNVLLIEIKLWWKIENELFPGFIIHLAELEVMKVMVWWNKPLFFYSTYSTKKELKSANQKCTKNQCKIRT